MNKNIVKNKIKRILLNNSFIKESDEVKNQVIKYNILSLFGIIIFIAGIIVNSIELKYELVAINFAVLFITILLQTCLNKRKLSVMIISFFAFIMISILFLYYLIFQNMNDGFHIWALLFPIVILLINGPIKGSIFNLIFFISSIFLVNIYKITFTNEYLYRFFTVYVLIYILFLISESIRLRFQRKGINENKKLTETIEKYKMAQDKIIELEKRNSVLAMIVTTNHDLNQPLTVLNGNLDLFLNSLDNDYLNENQKKFLFKVRESFDKINTILKKYRETKNISFGKYHGKTTMVVFDEEEENK